MTETSKGVLATLLVVTILVSVIGTWATLMAISSYQKAPVSTAQFTSGKVSVRVLPGFENYVPAPPTDTDGIVAVNVAE